MAATYTTWTRGAVTTLFMVMASWMGLAQSTMPKMISNRVVKDADKEMSLSRFAEAHDLYRAVAMSDHVRAQKTRRSHLVWTSLPKASTAPCAQASSMAPRNCWTA